MSDSWLSLRKQVTLKNIVTMLLGNFILEDLQAVLVDNSESGALVVYLWVVNLFCIRIFRVVVSRCGHHGAYNYSESVNITPQTPVVGSYCVYDGFLFRAEYWWLVSYISFFVLIVDRLRPRILLFLSSFTRRCGSLCSCCISRLPVLGIRRGIFRLVFTHRNQYLEIVYNI
jgi:hypothetical protein